MKQNPKVLTLMLFSVLCFNLYSQGGDFDNDPIVDQSSDDRKFRLGLQFSPTLSSLKPNTSGYEKEGSKLGFTYGLSTEIFLSKNYLLSTGVFISSLGGKLSYEGTYIDNSGSNIPTDVIQSYNIKYLEIPFTLKLRTNEIGYMTYFGNFGLRTGTKFSSSSDFTYLDIAGSPKVEGVSTSSDVFFFNTWLVIGGGGEYNVSGNTNISVGLNYNNGFINVLDTKVNLLDANGNAALDASGNPLFTDKNASANLNYFSLDIAVYF